MKHWLITGGCGFIGKNLIDYLINQTDDRIVILDNLTTGDLVQLQDIDKRMDLANSRIQFVGGDVCDKALLESILKDINYVVHLAAQSGVLPSNENPEYSFQANSVGTFNLLLASSKSKVESLVLASSGAVVGKTSGSFKVSDPPNPLSIYGATKACNEMFAKAFSHMSSLNVKTLRFGNVYGPHSKKKQSVIPKFIKTSLQGDVFKIYGDGYQTRDFIFVGDLILALVAASLRGKSGKTFHLAAGKEVTVNHLIAVLQTTLSRKGVTVKAPENTAANPLEVRSSCYDISSTSRELEYAPQTTIEEGIEKTVDWFLGQNEQFNFRGPISKNITGSIMARKMTVVDPIE